MKLLRTLAIATLVALSMGTSLAQDINTKYYHRIVSAKTGHRAVDIQGQSSYNDQPLVIWTNTPSRTTQDWEFRAVGDYYQILSRHGGWAIHDQMDGDATTAAGWLPLIIVTPDATSDRQLWKIVPQSNGQYNLKNKATGHIFNVNGGTDADGTNVIGYTSNEKDATSTNRLWTFASPTCRTSISSRKAEPPSRRRRCSCPARSTTSTRTTTCGHTRTWRYAGAATPHGTATPQRSPTAYALPSQSSSWAKTTPRHATGR